MIKILCTLFCMIISNIAVGISEADLPRLHDDDRIPIPTYYQACFKLIETISQPGFKFKDAVPLIREHEKTLISLHDYEGVIPVNALFVLKYQQTLRDEFVRLTALLEEEKTLKEGDKTANLFEAHYCLYQHGCKIVRFYKNYKRNDTASPVAFFGMVGASTSFYQAINHPEPLSLTSLYSKAVHKILLMGYIGEVFSEISTMVREKKVYLEPDGPAIEGAIKWVDQEAYLDGTQINLERDGDLSFTSVFDRIQVREGVGMHGVRCGSKIFDYIKYFLPEMDFRDDLPVGCISISEMEKYV